MANTSSRNTDVGQRLKVVEKLLNDLMKHKDAWPFLKPVSKREVLRILKFYEMFSEILIRLIFERPLTTML